MSQIDYMKIIDIMARTLRLEKTVSLEGLGTDIMNATVTFRNDDKTEFPSRVVIGRYSMDISLRKAAIPEPVFRKWIPEFEYELEQTFARNVEIDIAEDKDDYLLKIRL